MDLVSNGYLVVSIDVDFVDIVFDVVLNFFNWYVLGLWYFFVVFVDDVL